MSRKFRRPLLALGLVAAAAVLVALVAGAPHGQRAVAIDKSKLFSDPDRAVPRASGRSRALAGDPTAKRKRGEAARTPSTVASEEYADRAYPAPAVKLAWKNGARDAFRSAAGRGADGSGSWQLAGPTTSTFPALLNRTNAPYDTSGRVTAMAIDSTCTASRCRVWSGAAGGGIWRADNGLAAAPDWKYVSAGFATNAIGALTYDAASHTLYAGTGEPNSSADSEAGVGIYASTDGGDTWSLVPGSPVMSAGNSISSIALDAAHPGTYYVGTTIGIRGIAGVAGANVFDPNAPKVGLWKTTDSGRSFSLVYDDSQGAWGVNHVEVDAAHGAVYMGAFAEGIQRSTDGGASWQQVFATQDTAANGGDDFGRTEFALATQADGHVRLWVGDGGTETGQITPDQASFESTSGVYRTDSVDTKTAAELTNGTTNPGFTGFTTFDRTKPGYLTYDYCWGQCSYDNLVISPAGHPEMVYILGAYNYDFPGRNNGRAVLLSTDSGAHWYDQTADLPTADGTQNGIHPDQHALVVNPSNPLQFFEGSDGGVIRSSGSLVDGSGDCGNRGLSPNSTVACKNSTARIPSHLDGINAGLSTLQFGTVSVNPTNPNDLQGGTQDNGTWEGLTTQPHWGQTMWGDGGVSAFDIAKPNFRLMEFYNQYSDITLDVNDPLAWVTIAGRMDQSHEKFAFYKPQINDPAVSGTFFIGGSHVWRSQNYGGVTESGLASHCTEFQAIVPPDCGDVVPLGDPSGKGGLGTPGDLTAAGVFGTDKTDANGRYVVQLARTPSDKSTLWVATRRGRVFISKNADAAAPAVSFTRIDAGPGLSATSSPTPRRYVAGIVVDPANANHAFVAFGGYDGATDGVTPPVAGHVFDVTYDPITHKATWTSLDRGDGSLGDQPVNTIALDEQTNRLYVGTDFGVLVSVGKSGKWRPAADGLPMVAVSGLTYSAKNRTLYAATHGRAMWALKLNGGDRK
jgi:hypothetical protein